MDLSLVKDELNRRIETISKNLEVNDYEANELRNLLASKERDTATNRELLAQYRQVLARLDISLTYRSTP